MAKFTQAFETHCVVCHSRLVPRISRVGNIEHDWCRKCQMHVAKVYQGTDLREIRIRLDKK